MNIFLKRAFLSSFLCFFTLCFATTEPTVIDQKTLIDLDALPKNGRQSLAHILQQPYTLHGKEYLYAALSTPITSIETLHQRQADILFLIDNKDLAQALRAHLSLVAPHEQAVSCASTSKNPLSAKALNGVYFSSEKLQKYNTVPLALDVGYLMHIAGLCLPLAEYAILHTGIGVLFNLSHDHSSCGGHHPTPEAGALKYYGAQTAILACHVPSFYEMVKNIKERALITQFLQQEMIHVSAITKQARAIYYLLKQDKEYSENFDTVSKLEYFFGKTPRCSAPCQKLLWLLKRDTFTTEVASLSHVGNILAAYRLYHEVHEELALLTQALGEIDLYLACADTMRNQTEQEPWCFVEYKDAGAPSIVAQNLRHLFLQKSIIKPWSVDISEMSHTLLTGDNGSGKSTYINGLGQALLLAQTLGIVPAQKFAVTPFAHIATYRFIDDNIFEGTSRFYAECARIENILETVEQATGFCCILLDEPFTSTHATKGCAYLQEAFKRLLATRHTVSFVATHYHTLDTLVAEYTKTRHLHL